MKSHLHALTAALLCSGALAYGQSAADQPAVNDPQSTAPQPAAQSDAQQPATPSNAQTSAQPGAAQADANASPSAGAAKLENDDQDFVKMAAQLGMAEVQKGMLGTKKASREEVKALAEKMVTDHTMMNDELKTLASSKAVEISAVIDPNATEALKDLENKATGEEFDKAFLDEMEKDHEKTISAFEDAAKDGKDAQVKAFAEKHLPHLRSHLEQVKSLKDNK